MSGRIPGPKGIKTMNKTLIYLLLLVCVGAAVYFFVLSPNNSALGGGAAAFTIRDTAEVGKIFLVDKQGNQVLLEREKGGPWMLNGRYKPIDYNVDMLLTTLSRQSARYPVPQGLRNQVIKSLATHAVKVEVYRHSGRRMKTFYVGGQSGNSDGSYMILEGEDQPYVVGIMGVIGYLVPRYSTEWLDWRDRPVFRYRPEEIQAVRLRYEETPEHNFSVRRGAEGKWNWQGEQVGPDASFQVNPQRVRDFMSFFEELNHEGFLVNLPGMDSVLSQVPRFCTVELVDSSGDVHALDLYWMPLNQRSKNLEYLGDEIKDGYDADRLYGVMRPAMDTVLIQRYVFGKVFRKAFEFLEERDPSPVETRPEYRPDTLAHPQW